jgi:hypothetical protein
LGERKVQRDLIHQGSNSTTRSSCEISSIKTTDHAAFPVPSLGNSSLHCSSLEIPGGNDEKMSTRHERDTFVK